MKIKKIVTKYSQNAEFYFKAAIFKLVKVEIFQ